jgi:hypothetical protein
LAIESVSCNTQICAIGKMLHLFLMYITVTMPSALFQHW